MKKNLLIIYIVKYEGVHSNLAMTVYVLIVKQALMVGIVSD